MNTNELIAPPPAPSDDKRRSATGRAVRSSTRQVPSVGEILDELLLLIGVDVGSLADALAEAR